MKKRICVITGSRAEYGILRSLLKEIKKTPGLFLQIIATGSHLSRGFGFTYREIEEDGFFINEKIRIVSSSDTAVAVSKSMGLAVIGFAKAFAKLKPDMIVVLGDRYEIFAAAGAACVARVPVAHIHGGERSEGAIDDSFRHAITKMSHLHFTAAEEYRKRVIQMGEHPSRVFNVGSLALDTIARMRFISKEKLEKQLGLTFSKPTFLVTYHPVTLEHNTSGRYFKTLLDALDELKNVKCIFTYANADTNGRIINSMIEEYVAQKPEKAVAFPSLGQLRYLSAMKNVDAVVGNSSSGIIEAPSFKIGTINIGDRQKGRMKAPSVIDCKPTKESISWAFNKLFSPDFQKSLGKLQNPYGSGGVAKKIIDILKKDLPFNGIKKEFFDISF